MGTVSSLQRFRQLCFSEPQDKKMPKGGGRAASGAGTNSLGNSYTSYSKSGVAAVVVESLRGTATPMPMGLPTTTMGQAMASTTLHLVERSLLVARPTPPTTTTTLGQLPPRPNSQFD